MRGAKEEMETKHKLYGPYEKYFKRPIDFCCGLAAVIVFSWLYAIVAILVRFKLGSPVLFTQERPGKDGKIFKMYKFRTMSNATDENPALDFQYIETELGKLSLDVFYRNTRATLSAWFEKGADTDMTDFITDKIFCSGSFGTSEDHLMSGGARAAATEKPEQVRWHKGIQLIFPSVKALSRKYPVLKRWKLLLPFVWVYRWVTVLLFRRGNIRRNFDKINTLTAENIRAYQAELNHAGLNFNFDAEK